MRKVYVLKKKFYITIELILLTENQMLFKKKKGRKEEKPPFKRKLFLQLTLRMKKPQGMEYF